MPAPDREKKSESLEVRLPYSVKRALMRKASQNGETASDAMRRFIKTYIESGPRRTPLNHVKDLSMTLIRNWRKSSAMLAACTGGVLLFAAAPSAADSDIFDAFDHNADGVLTPGEIGAGDHVVIDLLDADRSGGVTLDEFKARSTVTETRDSVRAIGDDADVRVIEVRKTEIRLSANGEAQTNIWSASEDIDLAAPQAEVETLIAALHAKVADQASPL